MSLLRGARAEPGTHRLVPDVRGRRHRSLWLREVLAETAEAAPLYGSADADIAIVGGGYLGLWTAIRVKSRQPSLRVTVLEQDVCGSGASGRNGGHANAWYMRLPILVQLYGRTVARDLLRQTEDAVAELEWVEEQGFDIGLRRDGWIWSATTRAQVGAWDPVLRLCKELDLTGLVPLSPEEVAKKCGSPVHLAGVWQPSAATVHPARLVRALRSLALRFGVTVYERTPVTRVLRGPSVTLVTPEGELLTNRVVLATGAWSGAMPEFSRSLFIMSATMAATAAAPDELAAIGRTDGVAICDSQELVLFQQATRDGRIVLGRGGGHIALGGRVDGAFDLDPGFGRLTVDALRRLYPSLAHVPIEEVWTGPIDRSLSTIPTYGDLDGRGQVFYGHGFSGNGVLQTAIGGRILASLVLETDDEWSRSPMVGAPTGRFPPDPWRYLGAQFVQRAVIRKSRALDKDERPGTISSAVSKLVPSLSPSFEEGVSGRVSGRRLGFRQLD
jgi:glycine/D-amino acid oxidase-like deaminating enzyme